MKQTFGSYLISDEKGLLQIDRIHELLSKSYWAKDRLKETIQKSIEHSLCFGVYIDGLQIGFARCITDYATMYYLADVIIDEKYRGQGLGKAFVKFIIEHKLLRICGGILDTSDAHGLYEQFGFARNPDKSMRRSSKRTERT